MNELDIQRHSFDLAKNRLKEFSEKTQAKLEIKEVRIEGGFFGLGDHKVTGEELNERLESIQEHLTNVNTTNNRTIKEFKEVYTALDSLDKDYITSIVASVKAIEKTSNDVRTQQVTLKQHNEKMVTQQNKLDSHQIEIEKNVANIKKMVTVLKSFKENLDGYKHLGDVDKIWSDVQNIHTEIVAVSAEIKSIQNKVLEQQLATKQLCNFKGTIESYQHLKDIDDIWEKTEVHSNQMLELGKQSNETKNIVETNKESTEDTIASIIKNNDVVAQMLTKKIKYANLLAAGSLALAIIELVVILLKVI